MKPAPYSQEEFVHSMQTIFAKQCEEKQIELVFDMGTGARTILVDRLHLSQIFYNLLSNAIKFTPCGGKVVYRIKERISDEKGELVTFQVEDNGIGMSREFLNHMFDAFSQEHDETIQANAGTGLGLSIAYKLTTLMGGTISARSEKGKGTVFTVKMWLPYATEENFKEEKSIAEEDIDKCLKDKRVLVADDHPLNLQIITRLLEKKGILVTSAGDGQQALEKFEASEVGYFDALLMDVRMPNMDGMEAASRIRQLTRKDAKRIPIIAVTANAYDEDAQACLDAGMNDHMAKPIESTKLYELLFEYFI